MGVLFDKVVGDRTLGYCSCIGLFSGFVVTVFEILSLPQNGHTTFALFDTILMLT